MGYVPPVRAHDQGAPQSQNPSAVPDGSAQPSGGSTPLRTHLASAATAPGGVLQSRVQTASGPNIATRNVTNVLSDLAHLLGR